MKKDKMILTYEQARELQWFCQNVAGVRIDFYSVMEKAYSFDDRLTRLEKTCETIEKFFGEQIKPTQSAFVSTKTEGVNE